MTERERDSGGKYVETVQSAQVLRAVREASDPVVTASEVAEMLDCSTSAARKKLTTLHENGEINRKKVGGRAVVWWSAEDTADSGLPHEQAFEAFADRLTDECGEEIEEIILYGSVARGDHREDSDVDVLIILEDESERERVRERSSYIGFDIMLEYDSLIAETITTEETFEAQKEGTYFTAVRRDGRAYNSGRNFFHRFAEAEVNTVVNSYDRQYMSEDPATELELAYDALAEAEALRQQETERGAVNRLYYACFHAARAVLYDRGFDPESHGTVIRWFGRDVILEGDASDDDGRFLRQLYTKRQNADYRQKELVVNVDSLYARAEIFVDDMAELLDEDTTDDNESEPTDE